MALDADLLLNLAKDPAKDAWRRIIDQAVEIASRPLTEGKAATEVTKRDREIGALDHFLSSSGWDLWRVFGDPTHSGVERTAGLDHRSGQPRRRPAGVQGFSLGSAGQG